MTDNVAQKMASESPLAWAEVNCIKLQAGVWDISKRPYLVEPLNWSMLNRQGKAPRRMCAMKGSQGGYTQVGVTNSLHGMIHGHYPQGVLYLFPTTDNVREFSKSRFAPLIAANPTAIGQYVKDTSAKTDTAALKRVAGSFLFLRGAGLTTHLEAGSKDAQQLHGIPADAIIWDEVDLMEKEAIGLAKSRFGNSEIKHEMYLANPSIPGKGIASIFEESDQRHWFRRCGCGAWTCAELSFPDLVGKDDSGKGYIACEKCGKPVGLSPGQWVPAQRDNSDYMWGYRWSQLTSSTNDPWEILQDYQNPPNDDLAAVVRMRLGLPFIYAEDKLTTGQVLSCCGSTPQLNSSGGPCAMGVDVRRHKNIVIGQRSGKDRYTVLRVARLTDWDDVMRMAIRFNVRSCVIDIRPYEDSARQFQKKAKFKTWLCEYSESTPMGTQYNDKTGIVKVNRTEVMDATHRLVSSERQLEIPASCPEVKQFAIECASVAKVEEVNKRTKQVVFRYHKLDSAPDDYRHALNYFYLAASGGKIAVSRGRDRGRRPTHAKNSYARC